MKIKLFIRANEGYSAGQVKNTITVGELREMLEGYDDDIQIVTDNLNNGYGANYGSICRGRYFEEVDEEE